MSVNFNVAPYLTFAVSVVKRLHKDKDYEKWPDGKSWLNILNLWD